MGRKESLSGLLAVYSVIFFGFGLFVLFFEAVLVRGLNLLQGLLAIGHPMGVPVEPFWKFVSISLLFTLGILCWWAKKDVVAGKGLIQLLIYCKFFSAALYFIYFFGAGFVLPYFFGGLTDFSLGLVALIFFLRAFPGALRDLVRFSP